MNNPAYLVVSVKELSRALRVAKRSQRACKGSPTHCIVLDLDLKVDQNGKTAICSNSFARSLDRINEFSRRREELDKPLPTV